MRGEVPGSRQQLMGGLDFTGNMEGIGIQWSWMLALLLAALWFSYLGRPPILDVYNLRALIDLEDR